MVPTGRCPLKLQKGIPEGSLFIRFIHAKTPPGIIDTIIFQVFQVEDRMDRSVFQGIYSQQKAYFNHQMTKSYEQRVEVLKDLRAQILKYESRIIQTMQADMAKPETEATGREIWYVLEEIGYTLRQLKSWMKPQRKRTPLLHFRASSAIYPEPYGQVLIMAPWNYPFHLLFSPLVGALAAGNTAILKPSELAGYRPALPAL
jgi:aldehyde dehydrogenase (NAD+)